MVLIFTVDFKWRYSKNESGWKWDEECYGGLGSGIVKILSY